MAYTGRAGKWATEDVSREKTMDGSDEQFLEQMRAAVRTADVLSIFFVRVGQSMIVDTRDDHGLGPAVIIDEIAASPRDRLESMRTLRPGLPLPEHMTLAPWTSAVRDFETTGLLESLKDRCRLAGGTAFSRDAELAFRRLVLMERRYLRDLVRGAGMKTIWRRSDD